MVFESNLQNLTAYSTRYWLCPVTSPQHVFTELIVFLFVTKFNVMQINLIW